MKKFNFLHFITAILLVVACEKNDDTVARPEPGNIIVDFSFTSDGNLFQFTNLSKNAINYRWDFGDLSFYCDKENPAYRYTKAGGELQVTLTAMNDSGNEAYITKTINAPEVLDVNIQIDGNFDDWSGLSSLYEEPNGVSMQKIKMWGAEDYINVYIEGTTTMQMELIDLFINSDGDSNSGFLSWQWPEGSGADYLFEGPPLSAAWGAFYEHADPNGGWAWNWLAGSGANFKSSGLVNIDAQTNGIEFSIPKTQLGTLGSSIGIAISELTIGWAAVASFPEVTATSSFVIYELPVESSGFCE